MSFPSPALNPDLPGRTLPLELAVDYFAGGRSRTQPVRVSQSRGELHLRGDGIERSLPLAGLAWPQRARGTPRVLALGDGSALHCADAAAWDAWLAAHGQLSPAGSAWRTGAAWLAGVVVGLLLLSVLAVGVYRWSIPWVAAAVVAKVPLSADEALGKVALAEVESDLLAPSTLPEARQAGLREAFAKALQRADGAGSTPHRLLFRSVKDPDFGPNAFALPGGTIVLTDALVQLLDGHDDTLVGVLAHELGHVRHRHGMRLLVQDAALSGVIAYALGDLGGLVAAGPLLLGQAAYSRDAEREADAESLRVLRAAGIAPQAMVVFFEKLAALPGRKTTSGERWIGIAIASHPDDEERIRYFRDAR